MGVVKGVVNALADPRLYFLLSVVGMAVMVWKREKVASNTFGYSLMGLLTVFFLLRQLMGMSSTRTGGSRKWSKSRSVRFGV